MRQENRDDKKLIIIIDDDPHIRDSLNLLFSQIGFNTLTFDSVENYFSSSAYGERGCIIVDLNLGGLSGIDALKIFIKDKIPVRVILISAFGTLKTVRNAFLNDAFDFIEKPYNPNELIEAVLKAFNELPANHLNEKKLTGRQEEIRKMILKGMHDKEIAKNLDISPRTVEKHKEQIFEKLNVRSTIELLARNIN